MNAFTQIDELVMPLPARTAWLHHRSLETVAAPAGTDLCPAKPSKRSSRPSPQWPVQALEYKSFLRFRVGEILDELCQGTLRPVLLNTILDRTTGGMLITPIGLDDVSQAEDMV